MTNAQFITVAEFEVGQPVRFNYSDKVRQGRVEKVFDNAVCLHLVVDGDEQVDTFKSFSFDKIDGNILLNP